MDNKWYLCFTEYEDYMRSHSHLPGWIERRRVVRKMKIIHILNGKNKYGIIAVIPWPRRSNWGKNSWLSILRKRKIIRIFI